MSKWTLIIGSKKADDELVFLFEKADVKRRVLRLLKKLADEDDPRRPIDNDLVSDLVNVKRLRNDAPNWYRLKIGDLNIRIIFVLVPVRGEQIDEYDIDELVWDDCENVISIVHASYRNKNTYRETRRRWRRTRGQ